MFDHNPLENFRFRGVAIVAALIALGVYIANYSQHVFDYWKYIIPVLLFIGGMVGIWFKKEYSYSIIEWLLEPFRKNKLPIYFAGDWQSEYIENGIAGNADLIKVDKKGNWYENGILRWKIKSFKASDEKKSITFIKVGLISHKETKVNTLLIVKNGLHYKGLENDHIDIIYTRLPQQGVSGYSGVISKGFEHTPPTIRQPGYSIEDLKLGKDKIPKRTIKNKVKVADTIQEKANGVGAIMENIERMRNMFDQLTPTTTPKVVYTKEDLLSGTWEKISISGAEAMSGRKMYSFPLDNIKKFQYDDRSNTITFTEGYRDVQLKVEKLFERYTEDPFVGLTITYKKLSPPTIQDASYSSEDMESIHKGNIPKTVEILLPEEKKKTIEDFFKGKWTAMFWVNGKLESRIVHLQWLRGGYKWFENGKEIFEILGFAVSKVIKDDLISTHLTFDKWKPGNRIECDYVVHSETMISGNEQNDRWGKVDITFKKIE